MTIWLSLIAMLACSSEDPSDKPSTSDTAVEVDWDCDPIAPSRCGLPFPSTYFMEPSETTASGWQVAAAAA